MGAPYIYDISRLRVKDLHSATYIYVVRRLRVKNTYSFVYINTRRTAHLKTSFLGLDLFVPTHFRCRG